MDVFLFYLTCGLLGDIQVDRSRDQPILNRLNNTPLYYTSKDAKSLTRKRSDHDSMSNANNIQYLYELTAISLLKQFELYEKSQQKHQPSKWSSKCAWSVFTISNAPARAGSLLSMNSMDCHDAADSSTIENESHIVQFLTKWMTRSTISPPCLIVALIYMERIIYKITAEGKAPWDSLDDMMEWFLLCSILASKIYEDRFIRNSDWVSLIRSAGAGLKRTVGNRLQVSEMTRMENVCLTALEFNLTIYSEDLEKFIDRFYTNPKVKLTYSHMKAVKTVVLDVEYNAPARATRHTSNWF